MTGQGKYQEVKTYLDIDPVQFLILCSKSIPHVQSHHLQVTDHVSYHSAEGGMGLSDNLEHHISMLRARKLNL